MDNNFNQNGQFGGWSSSPYGHGAEMHNEYIKKILWKAVRICQLIRIIYSSGLI